MADRWRKDQEADEEGRSPCNYCGHSHKTDMAAADLVEKYASETHQWKRKHAELQEHIHRKNGVIADLKDKLRKVRKIQIEADCECGGDNTDGPDGTCADYTCFRCETLEALTTPKDKSDG